MTARLPILQYLRTWVSFLTATVFSFLLVAIEASGPQQSPRRASAVTQATPEQSDSSEAAERPSEYDNRQFRSGPPDTTPYSRPAVPEDYEPQGKPAIPSNIEVPPPNDPDREHKSGDEDGGGLQFQ